MPEDKCGGHETWVKPPEEGWGAAMCPRCEVQCEVIKAKAICPSCHCTVEGCCE